MYITVTCPNLENVLVVHTYYFIMLMRWNPVTCIITISWYQPHPLHKISGMLPTNWQIMTPQVSKTHEWLTYQYINTSDFFRIIRWLTHINSRSSQSNLVNSNLWWWWACELAISEPLSTVETQRTLACSSTYLTHWSRDKMDAISQTTFSNAFSWMKMFEYRLRFHWSLFLRVQLTISKHWFR